MGNQETGCEEERLKTADSEGVTVHKEISIAFSDLKTAALTCGYCQTVILMDLEEGRFDVTHCPLCHKDFDPGVKDNLRELSRMYLNMKSAKQALIPDCGDRVNFQP